jgi:hypothetical protein
MEEKNMSKTINQGNERIDIIKPHVRHFCKEGYLSEDKKKTLYDLSDQYKISQREVDALVQEEIKQVKLRQIEDIYKDSGQPDAALHDIPDLFMESKRQFPDMLNIGTLRLSLNDSVETPAFIPLKGRCGISIVYQDMGEDAINNLLQNIAVRLILSLPRGLAKLSLIDPANMGGSFINLSGLDKYFISVIDDEKMILPFLQNCNRDMASFNFNELGSKYPDVNAYNKANRSKARPYQIVLCSSLTEGFDENTFKELEKALRLANKTGLCFLVAAKSDKISSKRIALLEKHTTLITQNDERRYEVSSSTVNLDLFNKAYTLYPNFDSIFDSDVILKINNEYDAQKYPLEKTLPKSDFIRDMELVFAKDERGVETSIALSQKNDNILLISEQKTCITDIIRSLVVKLSDSCGEDSVRIVLVNSDALLENSAFPILECNVHSGREHYVYGVLKSLQQIIEQRKSLFTKEGITDYVSYMECRNDKLSRLLYVFDNINDVLDSDNLMAGEIVQMLDAVLTDSVKYGVHIIASGIPTNNLLKLNLNEDFNYKIFVSIQAETVELVTSNLISEEDLKYAEESLQGVVLKESSSMVSRFSATLYANNELERKIKSSVTGYSGQTFSKPLSFIDNTDDYPDPYLQIELRRIAQVKDRYVIGISRFYSDSFYSLPFSKDVTPANLLVMGDDSRALDSLVKALDFAREQQYKYSNMTVCDMSAKDGMINEVLEDFVEQASHNDTVVKGIVCLLNMDALDYSDTEMRQYLKDFVANTAGKGIYLLFHAKNDSVFQSGNLGEITRSCFKHKIALRDAPESLISPITYLRNADFIHAHQEALEIVYEGPDNVSGFGIDNVWLFKI